MKRALSLLLFIILLGVPLADFIDYDVSYTLPKMREYLQQNADNYAQQSIRYELNLGISLPASESHRWLSGPGTYNNIRSGDSVCEGSFNYDLEIEAWARESTFEERNGEFGLGSPGSWPNCGSGTYPNCPGDDVLAYWSESLYNSYYKDDGSSSKKLRNYDWRQISWRELEDDPWSTNEAAEVSTILKGSYRVNAGSSAVVGPFDASGSTMAKSGTFSLSTSGKSAYTITERLDVEGALLGSFNPNVDWEYYKAFIELGASGQDEYSKSNIHDDGTLYVYDNSNVGVAAPAILYVDIYDDGSFPNPEEITPGESIPVEIAVSIPAAPSNYYPLAFEFDAITMSGPSGFSFSATNLGTQCNAGYKNGASATTAYLRGTLTVPDGLSEGEYDLAFRVQWESCSGEEDCNGNGVDSQSSQVTVTTEVVEDAPDLTCTLSPSEYSSQYAVSGGSLTPGEGVEEWEVIVTNVGSAPAIISTSTQRTCSAILFGTIDGEGNDLPQPNPGFYPFVSSSLPQTINPGASRTVTISDVPTYCSATGGGTVSAYAIVNSALTVSVLPECSGQLIDESHANNVCTWEMDCAPPDSCRCQVYPKYSNGQAGEDYDFTVLCNGDECEVPVTWSLTDGATYGTITSSDNEEATVLVADSTPLNELIRLQASMNLGCPETTVCNNTITVTSVHGCTINPEEYADGVAGDSYDFGIRCDGASCASPVTWAITHGASIGSISSSSNSDATVAVSQEAGVDEFLVLTASTSVEGIPITCDGTIIVAHSPKNCTLTPRVYWDGEAGEDYRFDLTCEGEPCEGSLLWDFLEGKRTQTRFDDVGKWGAIVILSSDSEPGDSVSIVAKVKYGTPDEQVCYGRILVPGGEGCEITPASTNAEAGESRDFTLSCGGETCDGPVTWSIFSGEELGELTSDPNDLEGATVRMGAGEGMLTIVADVGYDVCSAAIIIGEGTDDDLLGCRIEPVQEYGHPGSHHEFDLYCIYADSTENGPCYGNWMITDGSKWITGGTFSRGGDDHSWADVDVLDVIWASEERVSILVVVPGEGTAPAVDCDAEIVLPSMNCLDLL
ncbi:hypothetical protein JW721_01300 [Candidatus Micrarchaeota archaeon]|nr:hypothetical protein [Candidatus Micrarchaeota archaeon]